MSRDIKLIAVLGLITCGVILATVAKIGPAINVSSFVSPILMVLILIGAAIRVADTDKSVAITKHRFQKGERLPGEDEVSKAAAVLKPATYNILHILYLSIVLLFASHGYFANALFWLVIWGAVHCVQLKHRQLHNLHERTTKRCKE